MSQNVKSSYVFSQVIFFLYVLFFISLVFAFNFFSSISIGLIFLVGIIKNRFESRPLIDPNAKNIFLIACLLYYLFQVASLLYTHNKAETFVQLRIKSALLFVPLALSSVNYINSNNREKLLFIFCFILFTASIYCIAINGWDYFKDHDYSVFFFHSLVKPIHQHAIFFSIYVFIILVFLIETGGSVLNKPFQIFLIIYFSFFLLLLSSKLVIVFYISYLFYYAISILYKQKRNRPFAIAIIFGGIVTFIFLGTTKNPVSDRFTEVLKTDMNLVKQDKFNPGVYFNDVQFRIIEWKFVKEIENENNRWWLGVSPGEGQNFLDKKYIEKNVYIGDPARGDKGFIGYNTHSELCESLLQSGIPGVLLFLLIIIGLFKIAWKKRNHLLSFSIILLIAFSQVESVFETQYGIMLFTFFPLFLSLGGEQD